MRVSVTVMYFACLSMTVIVCVSFALLFALPFRMLWNWVVVGSLTFAKPIDFWIAFWIVFFAQLPRMDESARNGIPKFICARLEREWKTK